MDELHMLTYGSICSGISSETVAWQHLGWKPLWFSEINAFCCSLLACRYPDVVNLGNVNTILDSINGSSRQSPDRKCTIREPPDIIVGGTPCQSFSIQGNRYGMDDERGKLSLTFMRIVERLSPKWVIWENVPNTLSIDGGRAFSCIISSLARIGYGWAYRVLDLRHFGIPQRRKRLFVVGFLGDSRPAVATLFGRLPVEEDKDEIEEVQSESMEGTKDIVDGNEVRRHEVWGWRADETPVRTSNCLPTLTCGGGEGTGIIQGGRLRILTITEIERLQGFPDGYTAIKFPKRQIASYSIRNKAIGNSFPPPVLRWIGERINYLNGMVSK
jgi:DNA (cytosine-5)-methyltransferase 1